MKASSTSILVAFSVSCLLACGDDAPRAPFAKNSAWPKFRHDEAQTGRSTIRPVRRDALTPWVFQTGKGIFSSPVIDADENIYIGSADRTFYSIDASGAQRWAVETGEIIDSSALLDDRGRVYFGSGDGYLRALSTTDGSEVWRFQARDPAENHAFIRWFEGNVAMATDGTLYVPNDNFEIYAINRDLGTIRWSFPMPDQTWSLPAIDVRTGRLFVGNNNLLPLLGNNVFGIDENGQVTFATAATGTIAASPVYVARHDLMVVGGFDGYVRAYRTEGDEAGTVAWAFAARDHIYSSPALTANDRVIQASADGTVYALDAAIGSLVWQFDARDPFRSSPAIDGDGNVYLGGGDGRLYVLAPDGTLRFRIRLIDGERDDLNSSPALGRNGAYIGGENGGVFFVPYDYCLGGAGLEDARCERGDIGEGLPESGAFMYFTTQLGGPLDVPPSSVDANQPLPFSLFVREQGNTTLALIDEANLVVEVTPASDVTVVVSSDRRFLTVIPEAGFTEGVDGKLHVRVRGPYLVDPMRVGLRMQGGTPAGNFDQTFDFDVSSGGPSSPLTVPAAAGQPTSGFALRRVAAPLPTILPSYNQIGFDSLYFVGGIIEGTPNDAIAFVVGGMPDENNDAMIDPSSRTFFPVKVHYDEGNLTLSNEGAFALEAYTLRLTFDRFRLSARLDASGHTLATPTLFVSTLCSGVEFYGAFLAKLGFCNPTSGALSVTGAALYAPWGNGGVVQPASGLGAVTLSYDAGTSSIVASIAGSSLNAAEHSFAVLLVDAATGEPVLVDYGTSTTRIADTNGHVTGVRLALGGASLPSSVRAHLVVDVVSMAVATIALP